MEPKTLILLKRIVVVTLITAAVVAGSFQAGWTWAKTAMRLDAVRTGHARYIIVDDLGHTQFEWLEKNDVAPAAKTAVK